jgi:hypothetical protein
MRYSVYTAETRKELKVLGTDKRMREYLVGIRRSDYLERINYFCIPDLSPRKRILKLRACYTFACIYYKFWKREKFKNPS